MFARSEAQFRRCEHLSLRRLLAEPGLCARTIVIATGGGVVLDPINRALMRAAGHVVLLDAPLAVLVDRLRAADQRATRPLLAGSEEDLRARLTAKLAERRSAYGEATMVVDAGGSPQDAVHRLVSAFSEVHP